MKKQSEQLESMVRNRITQAKREGIYKKVNVIFNEFSGVILDESCERYLAYYFYNGKRDHCQVGDLIMTRKNIDYSGSLHSSSDVQIIFNGKKVYNDPESGRKAKSQFFLGHYIRGDWEKKLDQAYHNTLTKIAEKKKKRIKERARKGTAFPNGRVVLDRGGLGCGDHDMSPSISYSEYKNAFQMEKYLNYRYSDSG